MMPTVVILTAGLVIVVGGILMLRLHAFVSLVLAALVVAALTSPLAIVRSQVSAKSVQLQFATAQQLAQANLSAAQLSADHPSADDGNVAHRWVVSEKLLDEALVWVVLPAADSMVPVSDWVRLRLIRQKAAQLHLYKLKVSAQAPSEPPSETETLNKAEFDAFLEELPERTDLRIAAASDVVAAIRLSDKSPIERVTDALGSAAGKLAILIVAASIIGACLLQSGAADQVVRSFLKVFGEKGSPVAFAAGGFVLAVPVFFDTVFLLMIPLAKSLYQRTRRNYLLSVLAIVVGGTMAHSLVPPTPGPLLIADQFQVPISSMILGGTIVGLFAAGCGLIFAIWANRHWQLVPPEFRSEPTSLAGGDPVDVATESTSSDSATLPVGGPSLAESLLPVLLPVFLMILGTMLTHTDDQWQLGPIVLLNDLGVVLAALCERNLALMTGAFLAVITLLRFQTVSRQQLASTMQTAIVAAGAIILVTSAGAAFGKMMEQTAVAELLQRIPATSPVAIVIAAFFVTTAVRTAQGSATVAMMTAAGVFGGLVTSGAAGVAPLYVALAVGCGSKPFAWMNDSGFLVITRMSGMNDTQGLRFVTTVMAIAGFAGLFAVILGVIFLPHLPA